MTKRIGPTRKTIVETAITASIRLATPAGLGRSPARRAVELAAQLREEPAFSMKTRSYIR